MDESRLKSLLQVLNRQDLGGSLPFPKRGQSELRKARHSAEGGDYFVTFSTANRSPLLCDEKIAKIIFHRLLELQSREILKADCCMIMPDHVHLVLSLKKISLSEVVRRLKGITSRDINKELKRKGQFWDKQYFDHRIRRNESRAKIVRYCYENPLRKGIVKESKEWPFWWCAWKM